MKQRAENKIASSRRTHTLATERDVRAYQPDLNTLAQLGQAGVVITAAGETYDFACQASKLIA